MKRPKREKRLTMLDVLLQTSSAVVRPKRGRWANDQNEPRFAKRPGRVVYRSLSAPRLGTEGQTGRKDGTTARLRRELAAINGWVTADRMCKVLEVAGRRNRQEVALALHGLVRAGELEKRPATDGGGILGQPRMEFRWLRPRGA